LGPLSKRIAEGSVRRYTHRPFNRFAFQNPSSTAGNMGAAKAVLTAESNFTENGIN
jgi:hypothetical protein